MSGLWVCESKSPSDGISGELVLFQRMCLASGCFTGCVPGASLYVLLCVRQ